MMLSQLIGQGAFSLWLIWCINEMKYQMCKLILIMATFKLTLIMVNLTRYMYIPRALYVKYRIVEYLYIYIQKVMFIIQVTSKISSWSKYSGKLLLAKNYR